MRGYMVNGQFQLDQSFDTEPKQKLQPPSEDQEFQKWYESLSNEE